MNNDTNIENLIKLLKTVAIPFSLAAIFFQVNFVTNSPSP